MRDWEPQYRVYKKNIIDEYNSDVFISSYSYSQATINHEYEDIDITKVLDFYKPKNFIFRSNESCPNDFKYNSNNFGQLGKEWSERQRKGWYTNKLSLTLFDAEKYDVIIKARPENPVKNFLILNKNLVIPSWKVHPGPCDPKKSLFDRFAYGKSKYMEKYLLLYDYMQEMYNNNIDISLGETLMFDYVKNYIGIDNLYLDDNIDWYMPTSDPKWASEQRDLYKEIAPKLVI